MTDHEIAHAMSVYGGSFVQAFGRAFLLADAMNRERMRDAFPELFMEYAQAARLAVTRAERTGT